MEFAPNLLASLVQEQLLQSLGLIQAPRQSQSSPL